MVNLDVALPNAAVGHSEVEAAVEVPALRRGLHALSGVMPSIADREVAALAKPIRATDEIMALSGLAGNPATPRELEWLLNRSCSLGLPTPLTLGRGMSQRIPANRPDAQWGFGRAGGGRSKTASDLRKCGGAGDGNRTRVSSLGILWTAAGRAVSCSRSWLLLPFLAS